MSASVKSLLGMATTHSVIRALWPSSTSEGFLLLCALGDGRYKCKYLGPCQENIKQAEHQTSSLSPPPCLLSAWLEDLGSLKEENVEMC